MEFSEKDYIKGFNSGYMIAEYLPELAIQLDEIKTSSNFLDGLKDGMSEKSLDIEKDLKVDLPRLEWLKSSRLKDLEIDKDREKDLDRE